MNSPSPLYNKLYSFVCSGHYDDLYSFISDRFEDMSCEDQITCIDFLRELYYSTYDTLLGLAKLHNHMYCYVYDVE